MILPLIGIFFGAALGAFLARRQGGKRLDLIQWAAVNAMIFGVIGMFVLIYIERANI